MGGWCQTPDPPGPGDAELLSKTLGGGRGVVGVLGPADSHPPWLGSGGTYRPVVLVV